MAKNKTFLEAIRVTEELLNDVIFMCESRMKSTYFTRRGNNKMDFNSLILFCLNFVKKSIQLELDDFHKLLNLPDVSISKQGFSEARQKISPNAFMKLVDVVTEWFYEDGVINTFKGYRLSAIDASILELNNSERLRTAFGFCENKTKRFARALASGIYDIENNIMIVSKITRYHTAERDVAIELIEKLKQMGLKKDLILFDRGYPSRHFISYLHMNTIKFLMRVSSSTLKEINESKGSDQRIQIKSADGEVITLRVLRFTLDSGIEEILVTNVMDEDWGIQEFKELYFKRWGIEVKYMELKSRLQLENFTGDTAISVEQDFYASVYLANMIALLKHEANEKMTEENEGKGLKYGYKVNTNILIGKLKNSLTLMLLEEQPIKRTAIFHRIMQEISRHKVPIRPGRSFKRNMVLKANKYSLNKKRCL
ncbi:mobile element protein [Halalkalibacter wakoensis JCM 9140]|uniref:Mobile element protein n=1 Tax=Halalkalibacter wakoensis JCM 9140 TaxID=1236970 RepID=W4Q8C2_9BACI|nr:IS4 family transposase [Halalkalibacter wakoensis]GAE28237.1 mobile element protein [Halalkalibacter wakoensis JCM 9140]